MVRIRRKNRYKIKYTYSGSKKHSLIELNFETDISWDFDMPFDMC